MINEPYVHGKPLSEWKRLGIHSLKEMQEFIERQRELPFDEERIDIVGSNGNTGEHYVESRSCPSS
jgi:hypothetical protein